MSAATTRVPGDRTGLRRYACLLHEIWYYNIKVSSEEMERRNTRQGSTNGPRNVLVGLENCHLGQLFEAGVPKKPDVHSVLRRARMAEEVRTRRTPRQRGVARAAAMGAAVLAGLALTACSGSDMPGSASGHPNTNSSESTVWLCKPGEADDPCAGDLSVTSVSATRAISPEPKSPASESKFDCFYVYPTASPQKTPNANLTVQPEEVDAALSQAAQFSQVCNVWAPMYRQRTEADLLKGLGGDPTADQVAYDSLLAGWKDYLAHDNHGRPVIFIGHSQGAAMLIRLLHNVIDPSVRLRHLMVSAIILGGNVEVASGETRGGSFNHISTCTSATQVGCVIAYSSFGSEPPSDSLFGRPGQGVSLQSQQTTSQGQQVACVNPVNFSTGVAPLSPIFLTVSSPTPGVKVTTPFVSFPGLYTAQCENQSGATWLQINVTKSVNDDRPIVSASLGPTWGLHLDDVNLALDNLVQDVSLKEKAYH